MPDQGKQHGVRLCDLLSGKAVGNFRTYCISMESSLDICSGLNRNGYSVYRLDSRFITDTTTFCSALASSFSLENYANGTMKSWDSVSDLLWYALADRSQRCVALLWEHSDGLIDVSLQTFVNALELLSHVADSLESKGLEEQFEPTVLRVFLIGSGTDFIHLRE